MHKVAPNALNVPTSPSKWDIIPIHTSDRGTFKQCRRRWYWSSPAHHNLVPKASVYGVTIPLWFGTGIHYALQQYYSVPSEDPVLAFEAWFNLQWNGGLVRKSEVKEFIDRKPKLAHDKFSAGEEPLYYVNGLEYVLPNPDYDTFNGLKELGIGMMKFYKDYAAREDNFTVVTVEHDFSVPILKPDGTVLYMIDNRTMPEDWIEGRLDNVPENNYGPLFKLVPRNGKLGEFDIYKQVHARGRQDLGIQDNETGMYGIMDHKTVGKALDDDYFRHLDLDEQCTTYLWAADREAELYDLPYDKMDFIIYQALRKAFPVPPNMTTRGLPSTDKQKESTTAALFEQCIKENNLQVVFESNEKLQAYYTFLMEQGEKVFIMRGTPDQPYVLRNKAQKANAGIRLYLEAMDMLSNPSIYPNPSKDYLCLNCQFRAPCIAKESNYDWEDMIQDGYESNHDR